MNLASKETALHLLLFVVVMTLAEILFIPKIASISIFSTLSMIGFTLICLLMAFSSLNLAFTLSVKGQKSMWAGFVVTTIPLACLVHEFMNALMNRMTLVYANIKFSSDLGENIDAYIKLRKFGSQLPSSLNEVYSFFSANEYLTMPSIADCAANEKYVGSLFEGVFFSSLCSSNATHNFQDILKSMTNFEVIFIVAILVMFGSVFILRSSNAYGKLLISMQSLRENLRSGQI
ncbi:hypothetical protein [Vibrio harveyi]|uniref:hypothetical protein n=1 Tax=Vibrio harveyi TaxID=669 RepID=UPI003CF90C1E